MHAWVRSFVGRMVISFGLIFLLTILGLGSLWYLGSSTLEITGARNQQIEEAIRFLDLHTDAARNALGDALRERRGDTQFVSESKLPTLVENALKGQDIGNDFLQLFRLLQRAYPDSYHSARLVRLDDAPRHETPRILASSIAAENGTTYTDQALVERARRPGVTELIEPTPNTLRIVRPIRRTSGQTYSSPAALLIVEIGLENLLETVHSKSIFYDLAEQRVLLGASGEVMAMSPPGQKIPSTIIESVLSSPGFEGALKLTHTDNSQWLASYRHIPLSGQSGWTLVSYRNNDEAMEALTEQARLFSILSLIASLLSLGVIAVLSHRLARPIEKLSRITHEFGTGNLSVRMPVHKAGSRELYDLATQFNRMADKLAANRQELEQKISERTQELARERDTAQRYLDIAQVMILALDRQGRIIMINQKGAEILGETVSNLLGQSWIEAFLPPQEQGAVRAVFDAMMKNHTENIEHYENKIVSHHGTLIDMAWSNAIVYDIHGIPAGILSCGQDITRRRADELALHNLNRDLEQRVLERTGALQVAFEDLKRTQHELVQREKMASLGTLVAGIAHELNTPLGNSITISSTLSEEISHMARDFESSTLTRGRLHEFIRHAQEGFTLLDRSLAKARDLVSDFKQVASDQASEKRRTFDLKETVDQILETISPQFKHSPHSIQEEIPSGIAADSYPGALGHIMTNLVLNALIHAFTPEVPGRIKITATLTENDQIHISVSDNGCGIPPANLEKVFDPFFTTRLGQGGSGLGLHIVYNMATSTLGGTIRVSSDEGKGSCFDLEFPRMAPQPSPPATEPATPAGVST